ncbi:protein enabled isoform X2 [Prorops nasuta]|uniref:protein enabled isoform X2 n=1 Tax=Prorops nasuta TaxID=863751 RepID=UPI0034CDD3C3
MNEVSISSARASVMIYDDVHKKWVPSGSSSGLSKVQLYHHQVNNTFRVVGRKLQDHEIVINCAILKGLKYNQATVTFHQWRDNKQVYGLNFSTKDDADAFARAMLQALDVLSNGSNISRSLGPAAAPATQQQSAYQQQPPQQQPPTTQYDEDMGYRTMTKEDVAIIQERRMSQQNQATNSPNPLSPSCPPVVQQQQQQQSGHHRTSSAPPAPQPQQQPGMVPAALQGVPAAPQMSGIGGPQIASPQPPAAPPCPPAMMNFNAPVPPPMMMNQYAQSPPCQTNIPNQSQSQPIYGTNQGNQYGTVPGNSQYASTAVGQSTGQYSGSQGNIYVSNGQVPNVASTAATASGYPNGQSGQAGQYATTAGQNVQYGGGGSQYGSNNSISQYATTCSSQYDAQPAQSQYNAISQNQAQAQYGSGQVQNSMSTANPYGSPSVNQYVGANHHAASPNAYAPVSSGGPPPPPMVSHHAPQTGSSAPPPPPPPPALNAAGATNSANSSSTDPPPDTNSLAAALQAARLKKKQQQSQPVENSGSSTSSSGSSAGNYGTLGRGGGGGMASMMDEMAKTLARRRAAVEKKQPEQPPEPESSPDKKSWDKNNPANNKFANGAESPKSARKRFGSASEDTLLKVNGVNDGTPLTAQEMEAFKAEIIKEVRKEFQKMKVEIVDAVRSELSRR